jgi:L-fucose mutarotase/ribose pyranase (RbsD/FucU family)
VFLPDRIPPLFSISVLPLLPITLQVVCVLWLMHLAGSVTRDADIATTFSHICAARRGSVYEVLWLLRVFNFERSKEEHGLDRAPGYPTAAVYEELLRAALSRLKQLV